MKTDAISLDRNQIAALEAVNVALGKLPENDVEWNELVWKVFRAGMKYDTEALEAENTAKDDLLRRCLPKVNLACGAEDDWLGLRKESTKTGALAKEIEAALTPPTGKVPVDREKLREVYVAFKQWLGHEPGIYPIVLTWLADVAEIADKDRITGGAATPKDTNED